MSTRQLKSRYPIYIVSKGRADSRLTIRSLEEMRQPFYVVVEEQEYEQYKAVVSGGTVLVLDKRYQDEYDTCDNLGSSKSKGPGPARNFAWDHALSTGAKWHWVMDDNIQEFLRLNNNRRIKAATPAVLRAMEDFCLRYDNVAMAGPQYFMFAKSRFAWKPVIANCRIYSCNLIRNDVQYRWRGRYNEDTDLSLRMLKDGWCTLQFNAFLQLKTPTQQMKGGNTQEFYAADGTLAKSKMLVGLHPDVARLVWRFGRWHHYVNYTPFKHNKLILKRGVRIRPGVDNYGMALYHNGQRIETEEISAKG